jgi:chromosome segregation ATPase
MASSRNVRNLRLGEMLNRAQRDNRDACERKFAPKMTMDRYKRHIDIDNDKLEEARKEIVAMLEPGAEMPVNADLGNELTQRLEQISQGTRFVDGTLELLEKWGEQSMSIDQQTKKNREIMTRLVSNAFPKISGKMAELETKVQLDVGRLQLDNNSLRDENAALQTGLNKSLGAAEMSEVMAALLGGQLQNLASDPKEVTDLNQRIIKLEMEKSQLETEMSRKEGEYGVILAQKVQDIGKLEAKWTNARKACIDVQSLIKESDAEEKRIKKALKKEEKASKALQSQLKDLQKSFGEESSRANDLQNQCSTIDGQLREKARRIDELEAMAESSQPQSRDVDQAELKRKREVFVLTQEKEMVVKEKKELRKARDKLLTDLDEANGTISRLRQDLKQLEDKYDTDTGNLEDDVTALTEAHSQLQADLYNAEEELDEMVANIQIFQNNEESNKETIQQHVDTIRSIRRMNVNLTRQNEDLQGHFESTQALKSKIRELKNKMTELENENARTAGDLTLLHKREGQLLADKSSFKKTIADLQEVETDLNAQLDQFQDELTRLRRVETDLNAMLDQFEVEKTTLQGSRDRFELEVQTLQPLADQVPGLKRDKTGLENRLNSLAREKFNVDREVEKLNRFQERAERLDTEVQRLRPLANQVPGLKRDKTGLENRLIGLVREKSNVDNEVTLFKEEALSLRLKVQELQPLADQVPVLEQEKVQLQGWLDDGKRAKSNVDNEVKILQPFREEALSLRAKVRELQPLADQVPGLEGERSQLQNRLQSIQTLSKSLNDEKAKVTALQEQAGRKDSQVSEMEKRYKWKDFQFERVQNNWLETYGQNYIANSTIGSLLSANKTVTDMNAEQEREFDSQKRGLELDMEISGIAFLAEIEDLRKEVAVSQQQNCHLRDDVEHLRRENKSLQQQMATVEDLQPFDQYAIDVTNQIAILTKDKDNLAADKRSLGSDKVLLQKDKNTMESKIQELQPLADQFPGLSTENKRLLSQIDELDEKRRKVDTEVEELRPHKERVQYLDAEVKRLSQYEFRVNKAELDSMKANMEVRRLRPFESRISNLQSEIEELRPLKARIEKLEEDNIEANKRNPYLQAKSALIHKR